MGPLGNLLTKVEWPANAALEHFAVHVNRTNGCLVAAPREKVWSLGFILPLK